MNEFKNALIVKEEEYQNGMYPKIPNFNKRGSAFVLTNGCDDSIVVSERTTVKQIRKGKYSLLAEISILPYTKQIGFTAPSKQPTYTFDVNVKAVIQVKDPIRFYENKNLDVDAYFEKLLWHDVKKITQKYSILAYQGMDDELTNTLSSYNTFDQSTGFSYVISAVDAEPGSQAKEIVAQSSRQQLETELRNRAQELSKTLNTVYEDAIKTEVIQGKYTWTEAIKEIESYKEANYETKQRKIEDLVEKGFITDSEARKLIRQELNSIGMGTQIQIPEHEIEREEDDFAWEMDQFYPKEE